jgi:hypothetical protein
MRPAMKVKRSVLRGWTRYALPGLFVLVGLLVPAMSVQATPCPVTLAAGCTVVPGAITLAGDVLLDSTGLQILAAPSGLFTTTVIAQVYRNAAGTLDFVYQFSNAANSATALGRLSGFSFACPSGACPPGSFTTDLFYDATDPSLLPTAITAGLLPTDGTRGQCPTCLVAAFDFIDTPSKVLAGETSPILLVRTDAIAYTSGGLAVIDGGAVNGVAFQPTGVPEPASLLLIGAGILGLGLIRRRRKSS